MGGRIGARRTLTGRTTSLPGVNWLELVGWAGSALLVWSLLQTRILRLRALNLLGCLILIGYNAAVRVWPMVGLNVVLALINLWYLRKMLATRHDAQTYEVVEVGTGDAFLAHTLRVHAADIARFNPGFRWDPAAADRSAFLVVRADEVVGVVVSHAEAGGVAQIDLDYVTPPFRDFTPGEFVFRRRDDMMRVGDVVKFRWEMVRRQDGETSAVGLEFLVLDHDGRIRLDYQFIES